MRRCEARREGAQRETSRVDVDATNRAAASDSNRIAYVFTTTRHDPTNQTEGSTQQDERASVRSARTGSRIRHRLDLMLKFSLEATATARALEIQVQSACTECACVALVLISCNSWPSRLHGELARPRSQGFQSNSGGNDCVDWLMHSERQENDAVIVWQSLRGDACTHLNAII
jgi:hypothetical protein